MSDPEAVDRMCKKISQLTRVIYLLNTKNDESDALIKSILKTYDSELENNRIFHRIVEITDSGLVTKGDALEFNDPNLLKYESVVGRVTSTKFPMIGPYVKFANSNKVFIYAAIGVWGLYFLISFLIVKKDMKTKKLAKKAELATASPAPTVAPVQTAPEAAPANPTPAPATPVQVAAPVAQPAPAPAVQPVPVQTAEAPAAPTATTTETSTTTSA